MHVLYRMAGPDCAVMCNLINIHTYIHTYTHKGWGGRGISGENSPKTNKRQLENADLRASRSFDLSIFESYLFIFYILFFILSFVEGKVRI